MWDVCHEDAPFSQTFMLHDVMATEQFGLLGCEEDPIEYLNDNLYLRGISISIFISIYYLLENNWSFLYIHVYVCVVVVVVVIVVL